MPLRPNLFERLALYRLHRAPAPLCEPLGAQGFKAVLAALRLGLFEALLDDDLDSAEFAGRLGVNALTLAFLLDALASLGYLSRRNGRYRNTVMTKKWMLARSPDCIADVFEFFDDCQKRWDNLPETIRNGRPTVLTAEWLDERPGRWMAYHRGMAAIARLMAPVVIDKTPVPGHARRLLDIGGGHGLYCARFCEVYPLLNATIFDLPHARPAAEATIARRGLAKRVRFQPGDFLSDSLGGDYDIILLFNVIRILDPEGLRELAGRIRNSLNPGGVLVIMDQIESAPSSPFLKANTQAILLELVNSIKGRVFAWRELAAIASDLGYEKIRHVRIRRSPGLGIVAAFNGQDRR